MATTRFVFDPLGASFPATAFPQLTLSNRRPALAFDASTQETCYWTGVAPQGLSGALSAVVTYAMASATTGVVEFEVALEAISDGDALDTDAADSFDTVNASGQVTVPGTAGYIDQAVVTLTNADSIAAGDYFRLSVSRDADDATNDTATGDLLILGIELREA